MTEDISHEATKPQSLEGVDSACGDGDGLGGFVASCEPGLEAARWQAIIAIVRQFEAIAPDLDPAQRGALARATLDHCDMCRDEGRVAERADFIAWLEQRAENAAAVAAVSAEGSELRDLAIDRRRQDEVKIGDVLAGMHLGAAQVRAELLAARAAEFAFAGAEDV